VKVTGDTITDAQIRELRTSVAGLTVGPHIVALCDLALGATEETRIVIALHPRKQRLARARCADAYNARRLSRRSLLESDANASRASGAAS
jgi:hypothetical protein